MVLRISRLLIQDLDGFPVQLGELALESDPIYSADIVSVVVFEEEVQVVHITKGRPLHWDFLDLVGLRHMKCLRWG